MNQMLPRASYLAATILAIACLCGFAQQSVDAQPIATTRPAEADLPVVFPARDAKNICPDTPLRISFASALKLGTGKLQVFDASDDKLVYAIDVETPVGTQSIGGLPGFHYYQVAVDGGDVFVFLPNGSLTYGKAYYVMVDDGAVTLVDGSAPMRDLANSRDWRFSTKPAPPAKGAAKLVVDSTGAGDFATVQGAVDFVPEGNTAHVTIFIHKGIYRELVCFHEKHHLTFLGEDRKQTKIAYANNDRFNHDTVGPFRPTADIGKSAARGGGNGPYRRGLFLAHRTNDLTITNLTLQNTTPQGGSQAEAIILNGRPDSRAVLNGVDLLSYQDTLQVNGQAYIRDCYIEGDVDFMWGSGPCFFENCHARSLRNGGYYTQIRNPATNRGYVFKNCKFDGAPGVSGNFLSRIAPARFPASEVVLVNCELSTAASPIAWRLDDLTGPHEVHFWEYNSHDENGASIDRRGRLGISKELTLPADRETIDHYSDPRWVLGGEWSPPGTQDISATKHP